MALGAAGSGRWPADFDPAVGDYLGCVHAAMVQALRRQALSGPIISDSDALADYLHLRLAHLRAEQCVILYLDARNRLIAEESLGPGTASGITIHARQILTRALELGASGLILVHNHPSGETRPSRADIETTAHLARAAGALDISLHDHIVIGATGWTSLKTLGRLP